MNARTTEYRYNVDGLLEELVCWNYVTPDGGWFNGYSLSQGLGHWAQDVSPHPGAEVEHEPTPDENLY